MNIDRKIHPKSLILKSVIGRAEYLIWRPFRYFKKNDLIVLNYHSTPKKFINDFKKQIVFLQKHFNFISPEDVADFYNELYTSNSKPSILLTFDDGLLNNIYAADVLNELNIKGLFFIVPDFIEATNQKSYYQKNIRDIINPIIDNLVEDFIPMNWKQVEKLKSDGHEIGCHSLTHKMKATFSELEMQEEVIASNNRIESNIGEKAKSFCAPNNSLFSVNEEAMKMIINNYAYFYSTFPGSNLEENNSYFILRSNVECFWPVGSLIHAIGKIERHRWKKERIKFRESIIKDSNGKN